MAVKTIGFFGDSFCSDYKHHSVKTYIEQVCNYYKLRCTSLGLGGSSIWDLYLRQFMPRFEQGTLPDICVLAWTEPYRLYHSLVRTISYGSTEENRGKGKIWHAAEQYYLHLMESDKVIAEYKMLTHYFDTVIAPQCQQTKFIHMWSFGYTEQWSDETFRNGQVEYLQDWQTGCEIRPSLMSLALQGGYTIQDTMGDCANHLIGQDKHDQLASTLIKAIDEYKLGAKYSLRPEMGPAG